MTYRILSIFVLFVLSTLVSGQVLTPPEVIKVSYNITNNYVQIFWNPSPSPETTSYEVWYSDDQATIGKVAFQKVPNTGSVNASEPLQMEFRHDRALLNSNGYFITAYGPGNATSGITTCDSTVFLDVDFDSCYASAVLYWNDYNAWRGDISGYKIFNSIDGINYSLVGSVSVNTNDFVINDIQANQLYRFYVMALRENPSDSSNSNRVDVNTQMARNPAFIHAIYGTAESGHPVVNFAIDSSSQLNNYILSRADNPAGQFDSITTIHNGNKIIEYTDNSVGTSDQPYYYKLDALNHCGQLVRSSENTAGTIFLESEVNDKVINLSWNSYQNWMEGVDHYLIESNVGGSGYQTLTTTSSQIYTDRSFDVSGGNPSESEVCYRVTAFKNLSPSPVTSISNEICLELGINFRFEFDAFIPGSLDNGSFGPTMDFIPKSVKFSIYNRWGNQVFETTDTNNLRWDGTYKNKKVDQGIYRYQLEYTSERGTKNVLHGNVTVIYP